MNPSPTGELLINGLLNVSLQASILVLLVLVIQSLLRHQLSARWKFALWWLVLIRLFLPWTPQSSFSLFNLFRPSVEVSGPRYFIDPEAAHRHLEGQTADRFNETQAAVRADQLPVGYDYSFSFDPGWRGSEPVPELATAPIPPPTLTDSPAEEAARDNTFDENLIPRLLLLWAVGAVVLLGLSVVQSLRFHWRLKHSRSTPLDQWSGLLDQCRKDLNISRRIELLESSVVRSPVICGLLHLRLLLPPGMSGRFAAAELRHVFLHELAHVKRRDLWLNWLLALLQAVHWFNPLIWIGFRRLRTDRELACDEIALTHAGQADANQYGRTIIKLLEGLPRATSVPGVAGILEDSRQMKRRIKMIAGFRIASRWSAIAAVLLIAILGAVTLTDAQTRGAASEAEVELSKTDTATVATNVQPEVRLRFHVVDSKTGQGLAEASVQANYFHAGGAMESHNLTTDENGFAAIPVSERSTPDPSMNLFVTAAGHVPKVMSWGQGNVPTNHTTKLDPASTIGGIVVDAQGAPVAGVKINIQRPGLGNEWSLEHIDFHPRQSAVTSDADGRWSCSYVPRDYEQVPLILTHPEFAVTRTSVPLDDGELTNLTVVINRGFSVHGHVRDEEGNPIADASVKELHNYGHRRQSTKTDAEGSFAIDGLRGDQVTVVTQAEGFAPEIRTLRASDSATPVELTLAAGKVFRGRVLDESGNPLANAVVKTDSDNQGLRKVEWSTTTDSEGWFEWNSAPEEALLYWFEAQGYNWKRGVRLRADGSHHEIRLTPKTREAGGSFEVTGTVRDADTGLPVPAFKALIGEIRYPDILNRPDYRAGGALGKNGAFRTTISTPCFFPEYVVQIQADGYLPTVSSNLLVAAGDQKLEFALRRGSGPAGVVLLPSGEPAAGATVFLCGNRGSVYMDKPAEVRMEVVRLPHVLTGRDGRFEFEPTVDAHSLIAVHEQGYAEIPLEEQSQSSEIKLVKYGRVEGVLHIGDRTAANEAIRLMNVYYRYGDGRRSFPSLQLWLDTRTDAEGRFLFEKVPPGERSIGHKLSFRDGQMGPTPLTQGVAVDVSPGVTTSVKLGGSGRRVVGRIVAPGHEGPIDWRNDVQKLATDLSDPPELVRPQREDFENMDDFIEASRRFSEKHKAYWTSPEGRARERNKREFVPIFADDGSFHIDDVPPGGYVLEIKVTEASETTLAPSSGALSEGPEVGSLQLDVTVPERTGNDNSGEPLDLGTLAINVKKHLNVGEVAPSFEAKTLDGRPLKLSDFRGKFVLLDFWATWCGPCVAQLPDLQGTYEAFGKDDRFVMIGLSLDSRTEDVRQFVAEHDLNWIQGFLGDWSKTTVPGDYGVTGIPALFLIDPEGRIVAKNIHGSSVKSELAKVLQ